MLSNHLILCRPLLFLSSIFPRFRIFSNNLALLVVYVCVCVKSLQYVWLFVTPRTVAHQDPLSVGFSRQENWGGLPWPSCPRGWTCVSYVSCTGSRVLYQLHHLGSPLLVIPAYEFSLGSLDIRCLEVSCFCLVPPLLHSTTDIIRKPDWAHVKFQAPCLCLPALLYLAIPPMSKQDCLPQGKDHFGLKFFKGFFFKGNNFLKFSLKK